MARSPLLPFPLPRIRFRRLLRRARRSPAVWWSAAALVALVAAARVGSIDDAAEARRASWGTPVPVVVAARDLPAGTVLGDGDVVTTSWPDAVVPAGALVSPPLGRTTSAAIMAGEAVVADRVAPDGLSDVAALLPPGWRAVAVPPSSAGFGSGAPPLQVGDRVDVLATFDALDLTDGSNDPTPTEPVAEGALVVDVDPDGGPITVAVPTADAPDVAFAVARGIVTLTLVGAQ